MDVLPAMDVAWVESSVHDAALRVMCSSGRGGPSIVDCTSFEIIRKAGVSEVFAYDSHFREQGFTLLGQ
jgi:predicted nucleic acid-binding protein